MEKICLYFLSKQQLLCFLEQVSNKRYIIDLENLTLSSEFSDREIHLATGRFAASAAVDSLVY